MGVTLLAACALVVGQGVSPASSLSEPYSSPLFPSCETAPQLSPVVSSQAAEPNQAQSQTESSPSTQTVHRKTGANSSQTIRHTRVMEESSGSPEIARAEDLIQKEDYIGAETLLRKVVADDPRNYVAWFDLGFTENRLGKVDDSIAAYRQSVAAKPDVFESNLNLGIQLAKSDQPDAEQFLRAATALTPTGKVAEGRERAWLSLAHVLETTKPDDAIAAYRQAAALQPKDPEPHLAAGQLLEKQNKFSDAETEYKQALTLDPASEALIGLANLYLRGRRFPEAEEYLRKVIAAQPASAAAHIELGRVLAAESKNDAAVAELQAGAKLAPADVSVQRDLADLYVTLGKNDQAETVYRGLIAGHPNDAELRRGLGQSLLRQRKFPGAQAEFLTAVKLKPDFAEAYGDLAFAASENKDYALTLRALETRAKTLPENPITHFLRASAYDHLKDFKRAAASYHLFLRTANGKYPEQEWQAKHRLIAIEPK
jgi:Flp pilus assembly protein TadD